MLMREQNCTQASVFATSHHPVCSSLSHDPASFCCLFCETILLVLPFLEVLGATAFADIVERSFALGQVALAAQALTPAVVILFVVEHVVRVVTGQRNDGDDVFPGAVERVAGLQHELLGVTLLATGTHEEFVDVEAEALSGECFELLATEVAEAHEEADTDVGPGDRVDAVDAEVLGCCCGHGLLLWCPEWTWVVMMNN